MCNSKQAMFAAIEIYNKPKFDYREEVFVILLINAWDLLLLAILSKNKQRIYARKKKGHPYKTLDFDNSYKRACKFFAGLDDKNVEVIKDNLRHIRDYRNTFVHYYGDKSNQHAIYALSQSAIKNYVDLVNSIFDDDIAKEISIVLLPLSFNNQPNFVEFFKGGSLSADNEFISRLFDNLTDIEKSLEDTSRFLTICTVKIENNKNIKSSDLSASYDKASSTVVVKNINLDDSHPFLQSDIIGTKTRSKHKLLEKDLNQYQFQAIVTIRNIKQNKDYCWISKKGGSPRYSQKVIHFLNGLSDEDVSDLVRQHKENRKK